MITAFDIDFSQSRQGWPHLPLTALVGSARTIGVTGLKDFLGVTVTGCRVTIKNANGVSLAKECERVAGGWSATFPSTHFENTGFVKGGVSVTALGAAGDETGAWTVGYADLKIADASGDATPGVVTPQDTYIKSEIVDGVQHYKKLVLTYSTRQKAWGADYEGDYIYEGGGYVSAE